MLVFVCEGSFESGVCDVVLTVKLSVVVREEEEGTYAIHVRD
jgi:hypothetical protein